MNTYTPGPWSAVNWTCHAPTTIKAADGTVVADTSGFGRHTDDCIPDAQLIAAAPDLLAACQSLPDFDLENPDAADFKDNAGRFMKAMRQARAAISKATGGQS